MQKARRLLKPLQAFVAAIFFFVSTSGYARPPTFGLELNLKSDALETAWKDRMDGPFGSQAPSKNGELKLTQVFADALFEKCKPQCERIEHKGKWAASPEWKFVFADSGFEFNVSTDPSTIEIQVGPYTLHQWRSHQATIKKYLFDFPIKSGYTYNSLKQQENSAHLNIGIDSAFDNARQFGHYVASYWQYWELGSGLLGFDEANAPPLWALREKQRKAAKKLLESLNLGEEGDVSRSTARDLAYEITHDVYTYTPTFDGKEHYQLVGLKYASGKQTLRSGPSQDVPMELRANRNPLTDEEALLQLELQDLRIHYDAEREHEPILFDLEVFDTEKHDHTPRAMVTAFAMYLGDMDELDQLERFRPILAEEYRTIRPYEFAGGNFDWTKPKHVEQLRSMSHRVQHSRYLRKRLVELMADPRSLNVPEATAILEKMISKVSIYNDDPVAEALGEIFNSVPWQGHEVTSELQTKLVQHVADARLAAQPKSLWASCKSLFRRQKTP